MKLYRYRPLSELLFKELLYSEIYLATPRVLNDPLDLNGQLNFYTNNENDIKSLTNFLFKQALREKDYFVRNQKRMQGIGVIMLRV